MSVIVMRTICVIFMNTENVCNESKGQLRSNVNFMAAALGNNGLSAMAS